MDLLPEEILLKIFGYVYDNVEDTHSIVGEVCQRWKRLAHEPVLCKYIHVQNQKSLDFLYNLPTKDCITSMQFDVMVEDLQFELGCLGKRLPNLEYLYITDKNPLSHSDYAVITKHFPKLKYMNVTPASSTYQYQYVEAVQNHESIIANVEIHNSHLEWMGENCANLKELHIHSMAFKNDTAIANLLKARSEHMIKVTLIYPGTKALKAIGKCENLKELRLYNCNNAISTNLMKLTRLKKLSTLHITGFKHVPKRRFTQFINTIELTNLNDLNLSNTPFSDLNAKFISQKNLRIQRLILHKCQNLSWQGALHLSRKMPHLIALDLTLMLPDDAVNSICNESNVGILRFHLSDIAKYQIYSDKVKIEKWQPYGHGFDWRINSLAYDVSDDEDLDSDSDSVDDNGLSDIDNILSHTLALEHGEDWFEEHGEEEASNMMGMLLQLLLMGDRD